MLQQLQQQPEPGHLLLRLSGLGLPQLFPDLGRGGTSGVRGGASPAYSAVPKSRELGFPAEMDFPATFEGGGGHTFRINLPNHFIPSLCSSSSPPPHFAEGAPGAWPPGGLQEASQ